MNNYLNNIKQTFVTMYEKSLYLIKWLFLYGDLESGIHAMNNEQSIKQITRKPRNDIGKTRSIYRKRLTYNRTKPYIRTKTHNIRVKPLKRVCTDELKERKKIYNRRYYEKKTKENVDIEPKN